MRFAALTLQGSRDYVCKGGGGDFVLPGCPNIQPLHEDMGNALKDPSGRMTHRCVSGSMVMG